MNSFFSLLNSTIFSIQHQLYKQSKQTSTTIKQLYLVPKVISPDTDKKRKRNISPFHINVNVSRFRTHDFDWTIFGEQQPLHLYSNNMKYVQYQFFLALFILYVYLSAARVQGQRLIKTKHVTYVKKKTALNEIIILSTVDTKPTGMHTPSIIIINNK